MTSLMRRVGQKKVKDDERAGFLLHVGIRTWEFDFFLIWRPRQNFCEQAAREKKKKKKPQRPAHPT